MDKQQTGEKGLESWKIALMVSVALFYDVVQILLSWIGFGWLIMPIFYLHFWMWFKMNGVKFFTMKRASYAGVGLILETLTAGILPAFTFLVLRICLDYKIKKTLDKIPAAETFGRAVSGNITSTPGAKKST